MTNMSGPILARAAAMPVGLLLMSAALTGCAHSTTQDAAKATAKSSSATGANSPSTAPAYKPLTKAQLSALLPTAASLPGWTANPSTNTPNDPETVKRDDELAACVGSTNTDTLEVAQASTPDFSLTSAGAAQMISAHASSFKTARAVTSDVKALKDPRFPACFKKQLAAHGAGMFGDGFSYVDSRVTVTPGTAASVAGRIDAVLELKTPAGKTAVFGVSEVALVRPGVEVSLTFIAAGKPVPAAVADPFLAEAESRLAHGTSTVGA